MGGEDVAACGGQRRAMPRCPPTRGLVGVRGLWTLSNPCLGVRCLFRMATRSGRGQHTWVRPLVRESCHGEGTYRGWGGPGGRDAGGPRRCWPHSGRTRACGSDPQGPCWALVEAATETLCCREYMVRGLHLQILPWGRGGASPLRTCCWGCPCPAEYLSYPPPSSCDLSPHLQVGFPPWGDLLRAFFSKGQSLLMWGEQPSLLPKRSPGRG